MRQRFLSALLTIALSLVLFCSCSSKQAQQSAGNSLDAYLGDYSYSENAVCMVYEPVEDEVDENGNPYYGIQYREITDLNGLLISGNTLVIYFYSSMDTRGAEITAAVEDLAQYYDGKLHVIMLDSIEHRDLVEKYDINAVPEFVLIRAGMPDQTFGSALYDYWTMNDVVLWLQDNGIS